LTVISAPHLETGFPKASLAPLLPLTRSDAKLRQLRLRKISDFDADGVLAHHFRFPADTNSARLKPGRPSACYGLRREFENEVSESTNYHHGGGRA
jgi:hypothetical protein